MSDTPLPSYPSSAPTPDDSPTFMSEVVDLLRQLKLTPTDDGSVPRAAPPGTPDALPSVPGYEILGELGRGGMGVVYKARQTGLNRVVALKMILAAKDASTSELLRFLAEAEAVAAVRHPNVVEVYELGQCGGRPYFAMEFVPGGSLSELLRPKDGGPPPRRLAPTETAVLLAAVARGVHAAHEAGIVHRDLKPGNVLLSVASRQSPVVAVATSPPPSSFEHTSGDGRVRQQQLVTGDWQLASPKVSDFGLAKRLTSDLTRTQAVMGTPQYMAPEQAGGQAKYVGPAADIYALGVILYECLTATLPFTAPDPVSVLRKVIDELPDPPSRRDPTVPRDVELICLKCLEKEPHHRYPTAAALADDLEAFAAGLPVSVRPVGAVARAWRWAKRKPTHAALAGLLLALAVVVPPVVIWNQGRLAASDAAADGARKAQAEAEKLAAARDLFGLENAVRRNSVGRPTGWTWDNRRDIARAAPLAVADLAPLTDLRSEAVSVALAADLRPADPPGVLKEGTMSVAATSPDGALVAFGEFKARGLDLGVDLGGAKVRVIDANTGAVRHVLNYPVGFGGGGQDGTRSLAFSPVGRVLYVGTRRGKVHRFDLNGPPDAKVAPWVLFKTEVSQLVTSPDGAALYARSLIEKPIHRLDAATGKVTATFLTDGGTRAVAVEPKTGDVIASDGSHLYRLSPDLKLRGEKVPTTEGHPRILAFACGGRLLVAACGDAVVLFDPLTLRSTARFPDPDLRRSSHQGTITALAAHPSGGYVATAGSDDDDRQVKVWEVSSGRRVAAVAVQGTVPIGLAWSGDGKTLHVTAPGQVLRFAFAPPEAEAFACFHPSVIEAATFSPDAARVAAVGQTSFHENLRTLVVSNPDGGTTAADLPGFTEPGRTGVAFDPLGTRVVVSTKVKRLIEWRPDAPPAALDPTATPPSNPRFSPDGSALWATVGSSACVWDATGRDKPRLWTSEFAAILSGLPTLDALAVGATRTVAGGRDGSVFVLQHRGDTVAKVGAFLNPGDPVLSVALSPDESVAAAGTQGGKVRLCRLSDGSEVSLDAHAGGATGVSFRRDGTLLATGGKDRSVKVWRRVGDGFELLFAAADLPSPVLSVEFSRADDTLLVLLMNEHAVRVWDVGLLRTHLSGLKLGW